MAEILGLIASTLGIISFGLSNMPKHQEQTTTARIGVGLDTAGGLYSAGGDVPDVRFWAESGEFLGITADPGTVDDGNFYEVRVEQGDNSQQAPYMLMSANEDGICVAYTSVTWTDGSHYGWVGDWGKLCGGSWYYSNIFWKNQDYKPLCTWLGSSPQTGISMHLPSFKTKDDKVPKNVTADQYCADWGVFQIHTEEDPEAVTFLPIDNGPPTSSSGLPPTGTPPPEPETDVRRRNSGRDIARSGKKKGGKKGGAVHLPYQHHDKLVVSEDATHHATERLCNDPTSLGPDFANVAEGQFCRMSDKTLWSICSSPGEDDCFDMETRRLVTGGVSDRGTGYATVMDWRSS